MRRRDRLLVVSLCLSLVGAVPIRADGADVRPISEVTALPRAALLTKPQVTIRGTVIRTRPDKKDMIVEDAGGGIWIDVDKLVGDDAPPVDPATIEPGMEVEVTGRVSPGGFSPPMSATTVRIVGSARLPAPRPVDPERLFAGAEDCRLVELPAVLQHPVDFGDRWKITMESASRALTVEIPKAVLDLDPTTLVDADVRIAGPVVSIFNTRGEFLRPWVFVDRPEWFAVVRQPPPAEAIPTMPLSTLAGFRTSPLGGHKVRTEATVVHSVPGKTLHLQDGTTGVRAMLVAASEQEALVPGDVVEVSGFLDRSSLVTALRHAVARRLRPGPPPEPARIDPAKILEVNRAAAAASTMARPGDFQGCLVRFPARLLQRQPTDAGGIFILDGGGTSSEGTSSGPAIVSAEMDQEIWKSLEGVEPGSMIDLAGVAAVDWISLPVDWPPLVPRSVRILVRGADDVRVISPPPWWTPARLLAVLGVTGAILAASLLWALTLRRRLAAKTRLLVAEMGSRRDAAIEFAATLRERNRLAANLHDTLQQTIGGIGFQLDACESAGGGQSPEATRHFAVARRMVGHAAKELQGSVWAMHSLPLEGRPFREALEALVSRVCEGHDVSLEVRCEGPLEGIPEFVAGSLLLVIQEAVHNSLRHARARTICVIVAEDRPSGTLRASVTDDGQGFAVGTQAGSREGHFGIEGMRERAERLGGNLAVRSRPGGGTTVEVVVEQRNYDPEIGNPRPDRERGSGSGA